MNIKIDRLLFIFISYINLQFYTPYKKIQKDPEYVIINSKSIYWIVKPKSFLLTRYETQNLFRLTREAISEYNHNKPYNGKIGDLTVYKVQLVPYLNGKNQKCVWVNCFCDEIEYWKKDIVLVDDGGTCYFNLKINLDKGKYFDFAVNGLG